MGRRRPTHSPQVHHSEITRLWEGTDDDRRRLAIYNLVDSYLPLLMMWRLKTLFTFVEIARACGIDIGSLAERGQGIRTQMLIQRLCYEKGYVVPDFPPRIKWRLAEAESYDERLWLRHEEDVAAKKALSQIDEDDDEDDDVVEPEVIKTTAFEKMAAAAAAAVTTTTTAARSNSLVAKGKNGKRYQGAIVLPLIKKTLKNGEQSGYYTTATENPEDAEVVATLDFASLYP